MENQFLVDSEFLSEEALAKKQIEHNQLFYGQNITLNINPNPLTNNENNKSITEQKPELIKDNADLNFEKIWK